MTHRPSLPTTREDRLPEILGERCVHSLLEQASCKACADACPKQAWVIDEEMLGIDAQRCDGCELCVPACPEAAIVQRFKPYVRRTEQAGILLARCEVTRMVDVDEGLIPCPHAIGTLQLLRLHGEGVRYLFIACGDCAECGRGGVKRLEQRVDELNPALSQRDLTPLTLEYFDAEPWLDVLCRVKRLADQKSINRRGFFRSVLSASAKKVDALVADMDDDTIAPGRLLPAGPAEAIFPQVPEIDARCCVGCDACVRLCPHSAIELDDVEANRSAYFIRAEQCTGCGICADVCEQAAVSLKAWSPLRTAAVELSRQRCKACGVPFHFPVDSAGNEEKLCRVCAVTNHYKNLYQVLD